MPSSRSSAVCTGSRVNPHVTMARATAGLMPTTTVWAPRSRAAPRPWWRRVRDANESMTSKGGDVDDDATGTSSTDLLHEVPLETHELGVVERGVDGRDEVAAPRKDRYSERFLRQP